MIKRFVAWLLIAAFSCTALAGTITVQGPVYNPTAGGGGITPPTLVSYTETTDWSSISLGGSKATGTVSWNAGDIIVVAALSEDGHFADSTPAVPTATGLTFASQKVSATGVWCGGRISTAVAAGTSSSVITTGAMNTSVHWGFGVWVFRNSGGVGNSAEQHTATTTVSLTPTQAHSAIVYIDGDFNADTLRTVVPTPTNVREATADAGHYTVYANDLTDQSSAGAVSYGLSSAGAGPHTLLVLEIKGL